MTTARTEVIHAELIADSHRSQPSAISNAPAFKPAPAASAPSLPVKQLPTTPPAALEIPGVPVTPEASAITGYLPIDAVDQPAMPLGDWIIDTDVLPRGYTLRMVLQLWISADGVIDHWELVGDTTNQELAAKALSRFDKTSIQPALLNQVAVPSLRQLEVVVTRE